MNRTPLGPWATTLVFLAGDCLAVIGTFWAVVLARSALGGQFPLALYGEMTWFVLLIPALLAARGLYPGTLLAPPDTLKRLCQGITLGFALLVVLTFLAKQGELYSRAIILGAWGGSLATVPVGRWLIRSLALRSGRWGQAAVLVGDLQKTTPLEQELMDHPELGLTPVALLDFEGRLIRGTLPPPHKTVAIVTRGQHDTAIQSMLDGPLAAYVRVLVDPGLGTIPSLWTDTADLQGTLLIDVRMKLLDPQRQHIKRLLDITITLLLLPLAFPLVAIIAFIIRLDSPGPIFFCHRRLGYAGQEIFIWKFRTMYHDSERILQEALATDPALRQEWDQCHKLRHDPRVTRIGRWLRRLSLDELPQLWNVLTGDLALVGPRPIVREEIPKYTEKGFHLYQRVRPGLTGLWQISGRSSTSYAQRVALDTYYVRNWSVWLDLYILACTPKALLDTETAC